MEWTAEEPQLFMSTGPGDSLISSEQEDPQAGSTGLFCFATFCVVSVVLICVLMAVSLNPLFGEEEPVATEEDIGEGSDGGARRSGSSPRPPDVYVSATTTELLTRVHPGGGTDATVPITATPLTITGIPGITTSPPTATTAITARISTIKPSATTKGSTTTPSTATSISASATPAIPTSIGSKTKRPLPLGSLICTLQTPFTDSLLRVPPDGLCTIVLAYPFYTISGITLNPKYYKFYSFESIVDEAAKQNKTEYGVGIDYNFCTNASEMTSLVNDPTTKSAMDYLWSKRFYHYGQVNPPIGYPGATLQNFITDCSRGLQMLFSLIKDKNDNVNRPGYVIFSFPLYAPDSFPFLGNTLRMHPVDIFIALGYHSSEDYRYLSCHMVPPTILTKQLLPPSLYNIYSVYLANTIWGMTVNQTAWTQTTSFAVSVGMDGRWYKPKQLDNDPSGPGKYQLGMPCKFKKHPSLNAQTSWLALACNDQRYNSSFKIDQTFQAMVGYNKNHGFLFTFDTAETLRSKLCEAKSNVTDLKLHVAAANIGAEDHTNQCGLGSLSRLRMLKALSLFFAHNYTSSAQKSKCLLVSP